MPINKNLASFPPTHTHTHTHTGTVIQEKVKKVFARSRTGAPQATKSQIRTIFCHLTYSKQTTRILLLCLSLCYFIIFQMGFRVTTSPIPNKLKEKVHDFFFFPHCFAQGSQDCFDQWENFEPESWQWEAKNFTQRSELAAKTCVAKGTGKECDGIGDNQERDTTKECSCS